MKRIISYLLILITLGLYAQPKGSCNIGTISLGSDGKLYGCVEQKWRGLSEQEPSTGITISAENGEIKRVESILYAKENGKIYDIKNIGFTPINISGEQHEIGKIIYSNTLKHFYVGVENNKWWQIDNEPLKPIIPSGWTFDIQPERYLVSVYDENYNYYKDWRYYRGGQPFLELQPNEAELGSMDANNLKPTKDPIINYQGIIDKKPDNLPKNISKINAPADADKFLQGYMLYLIKTKFTKQENANNLVLPPVLSKAKIPAKYIKNSNQDVNVYLNCYSNIFTEQKSEISESQEVYYYVSAEKKIDLVQLDLNKGIGKNGKGILLTTFNIPTAKGNKTMELRLLPAIPDRNAGKADKHYGPINNLFKYGIRKHEMFYIPYLEREGSIWLNNNLGAYYNQLSKPIFYPLQRSKGKDDYNAMGSLFQWQRKADGHELVNRDSQGATMANGILEHRANDWYETDDRTYTPGSPLFFEANVWAAVIAGWVKENYIGPFDLWKKGGANNPCPEGYHVPSTEEFSKYAPSTYTIGETEGWPSGGFHPFVELPELHMVGNKVIDAGESGIWWTSDKDESNNYLSIPYPNSLDFPYYKHSLIGETHFPKSRSNNYSIRCIRD